MKANGVVNSVLLGVVALCAVTITVVVVRRELLSAGLQADGPRLLGRDHQDLRAGRHLIGSASAKARLVVFSDFQCPYCKEFHSTMRSLLAGNEGAVVVDFRHFPLDFHSEAIPAAIAAECAASHGRFAEFVDIAFDKSDSLGVLSWEAIAARAGVLDTGSFRICRGRPETLKVVLSDKELGRTLGVAGTPALVFEREILEGAIRLDSLEQWMRLGSKPIS